MNHIDEQIVGLEAAIKKESEAADRLAESLDSIKGRIETMDAAGHRNGLGDAKSAFDELTRSASYRNSLAGRLAVSVGLKREMTVSEIIERLGPKGTRLVSPSRELQKALERAKNNMTVLSLLSRYGYAMMASLTEIKGAGRIEAPYGRNGHRTASYTRSGRVA